MTWNNVVTPTYHVQGYGAVTLQHQELRELRVRWSREAAEDLRAMHNLNAEAVLTELLSEAINQEIDSELGVNPRKVNWKKEGF